MMRCVQCDTELVAPALERQAGVSHLALPEMLRLFFVSGLLFCQYRHEAVAAPLCFHALR
jgi:hypothetical protein